MTSLFTFFFFFFFNDTATTEIYTLSLHDALPICLREQLAVRDDDHVAGCALQIRDPHPHVDRKSTRLNSSHLVISYAVFCLKKKKHKRHYDQTLHYAHPAPHTRTYDKHVLTTFSS